MAEDKKDETTTEFKPFESEEAQNNAIKSATSKGQNALLKSLGITSVEDFKKQQADTLELSKASKQKELDEADEIGKLKITNTDSLAALETANTTIADYEKKSKQQENLLAVMQIPNVDKSKASDIITLAGSRVTDDIDFTKAVESVIGEYPSFTGGEQQEPFSFGSDKGKGQQGDNTALSDNEMSAIWGGNPPK